MRSGVREQFADVASHAGGARDRSDKAVGAGLVRVTIPTSSRRSRKLEE